MKRRFTILTAALALLAFLALPMGMRGQTASFAPSDFSGQGTSGTGSAISATVDGVTFACDKGYGTTQIRCYSGGVITISSSNTITAISFTFSGSYTGGMETSYTNLSTTSWTKTLSSQARITACSVSYTGGDTPQPTTYTVTFDAGEGTFAGNTDFPNASNTVVAGTYSLPSATPAEGYVFNGWALGENTYEGGANYTVSGNADFVASYTENTTPTPGGTTATLNIQAYAEANSWTNGTQYTTATVAPVTFTANGGGNTGKYYESGHDWRFYQGESASITITVTEGYTLVSVTPTYSVSNGGVLKNGNTTIATGTTVNVSGTSVTFTVGNSGSATNGQVRFTNIDVVYVSDGGTQTASDLTITNQSTDLTFDLYNNTTAQVISYTTSSTGAITITPAESDYFSYVHDAAAKTITVTPTAVTPSAQTVTISQAADDDYYAGTATFTVSVANSDPNLPGTQNNPYTVAQARAAIDANSGTQGVYATGIVSAIPTAYNSTYGNVTFNMVDEAGDEVFLQAYRCGGDEAANVAVGDVAVVYGNLTYHSASGTYEFGQGCQLVSLTHPVITTPVVTVTPNTISAPAEGVDGTLTITYENITEIISFDYYFCDANGGELEDTDPDYPGDWIYAEINDENDAYTLDYIIDANQGEARTAYMKVYTLDDEAEEVYAIVTVNQEEYVAPTYAELPFSFNGGKADIESTDGFYQEGLGDDYNANNNPNTQLKFDGTGDWLLLQFDERPGTLTFNIKGNSFSGGTFKVQTSADGVFYSDLETYTTFGNNETYEEEFDNLNENVRYIKWVYTNKSSGNVGLGNIALAEYVAPVLVASITVNPDEVNVDAEEHDGTLDLTYENLTITEMSDFDIQFCDANGDELSEEPDWIEVLVAEQDPEIGEGYVVSYYMFENEGEARMAYFKVFAMGDEDFVYSNLVTVSQEAYVAPTGNKYVKVTSTADLTDGQYLIVYENGGLAFDGSLETLDAVGNTITVTINNNEIAVTETTSASEFTINTTAGTIKSASGYYIGQTSDANGLQASQETEYTNTISFEEVGDVNIVSSGAYLRYNNASNQNRFRYYKSASYTGQKAIQLYKKVEATETYPLTITGYEEGSTGGYHLIASPVTVDPATVEGMILTGDDAENYDLYRYDDSQELEWINYKGANGGFNLEPGKGYLYAKKATAETTTYNFTLTGTPYSGNGEIELVAGWNLIGNPFNEIVYLEGNPAFYTMNAEGTEIVTATSNSIQAMEGIFVEAESAGTVTFTTTEPTKTNEGIVLNLSHNRGNVVDRAIVRFGEGSQLHKLQIRNNSTKVYIPQNNDEYAVVRGASQGEMPVSFRAAENGNYTLSINAENVELNYLHLIDNMTGANIDLLQNPSYSFDANTTDYESRFRLVYAANNAITEQSVENFAFFSNGNLIVNNEGNATLQVVDITGRLISSNSINGSENINLHNMPAGIYTVRLINGKDVKVQKVAVR